MRFRVGGFAESTICAYAEEDWSGADGLGDPGIDAVVSAYRAAQGRALIVDATNRDRVLEGLTDPAQRYETLRMIGRALRDGWQIPSLWKSTLPVELYKMVEDTARMRGTHVPY